MKKLKIGKSDIHGKGLFTGEPIRKGDLIAKVHSGIQLDPETVKYMPTQYGRFYNHDEQKFNTTNEIIGNHRYLRALKNIPANTELTANYREHSEMEQPENFGSGKYASFDFDKTIATDEGLAKAKQMLRDGYNLFIVSARDKVTPDMVARARKAGIPEENIIATGSDEAKVRKVKQLGVEKHFDDKPEVIAALGLVGEQFKKGGRVKSKRYTKSLTGTNKLFTKNNLFKKKSTKRIYDPNAKYFDNGGETTVEPEVECTDDGRCYETDQIQNMLDTGSQIPYDNLGVMWGVQEAVNPEGVPPGDANKEWMSRGAQSLSAYLGMKNPANCMWAAGMGYQCLPETKGKMTKSAFKSNDSFISAVNKGTVPFKRVTKTNESDFDSKEKGLLRPGDIINFKGSNDTGDKNRPNTSHTMTFSHYREDGVPIYLDSNGEATDFNWNQGVWSGMKPNKKRTAYISRFDPEMFYKDKIETLEEAARNNPTYYKAGGALLTKKVTCKKCGWTWDAADGGNDMTTCHKCGGQGLVHARNGGDISIATLNTMDKGGFLKRKKKQSEQTEPIEILSSEQDAFPLPETSQKELWYDPIALKEMTPEELDAYNKAYEEQLEKEKFETDKAAQPGYFDEAKNWVSNWHDSPMYNQMVLNSYNGQQKNADYVTKLRKKNIADLPPLNVLDAEAEDNNTNLPDSSGVAAWSKSDTGQIEVFPGGYDYGPSLFTHEILHSSDRPRELYKWDHPSYTKYNEDGSSYLDYPSWMLHNDPRFPNENVWHDRTMPKSDQMYITRHRGSNWKDNEAYKLNKAEGYYTTKSDDQLKQEMLEFGYTPEEIPEYFDDYKKREIEWKKENLKDAPKNWKEFGHGYVSDPSEVRARLGEIRFHAQKENIYDPFTEQITPEIFQNYINKERDSENWQPLKPIDELREEFTDEEILYMLQNISKNDNASPQTEDEPQYTKQGGSIGYQLGDEVDEATMRQLMNQGYIFEKIR